MASGSITSWQIDGEKVESVTDFIFVSSKTVPKKVTAAMKLKDACSLEGKEAMTNLNNVLKSRDITLLTKVHIVKATVLLVVM